MESSHPFSILFNTDALLEEHPWQLYQVVAAFDTPELITYKLLFDKYNRADWHISLVDTTALIMQERSPELLDHVEFDEEGYLLDMYLDSEKALHMFTATICPVFQELTLLEAYLRRVADEAKA